jgi:hypothetical protein
MQVRPLTPLLDYELRKKEVVTESGKRLESRVKTSKTTNTTSRI